MNGDELLRRLRQESGYKLPGMRQGPGPKQDILIAPDGDTVVVTFPGLGDVTFSRGMASTFIRLFIQALAAAEAAEKGV